MAEFKSRLRELRLSNNLSGTELGSMVGVTKYAVSKWETGESTAPQDMIIRLASLFNVSTDYLLGRTNSPYFSEEELRKELETVDPLSEIRKQIILKIARMNEKQLKLVDMFIDQMQ